MTKVRERRQLLALQLPEIEELVGTDQGQLAHEWLEAEPAGMACAQRS
jgi:hypothetical protein